jgi:hypothetical protein
MDVSTRDAVSVVHTATVRTFFEPWPTHSQTFEPMYATPNHLALAVDGTKIYTEKRKEKPGLGISSSNKLCRYIKPPVQTFSTSSLLYPSKAHRICSVKMTNCSRERLFGLDVLILSHAFFNFIYVVYFHGEEYPMCVEFWGQIRGVRGYEGISRRLSRWLEEFRRCIHYVVVTTIYVCRPFGLHQLWDGRDEFRLYRYPQDHEDMNRDSLELERHENTLPDSHLPEKRICLMHVNLL